MLDMKLFFFFQSSASTLLIYPLFIPVLSIKTTQKFHRPKKK